MGDHDPPATCVSSIEHRHNVRDTLAHYFGCLRQSEKRDYFKSLPPDQQGRIEEEKRRIEEEERRIQELRSLFNSDPEGTNGLAQRLKISLNNWRRSVGTGMRMAVREHSQEDQPVSKPCKENCFGMNANMLFFKTMGPLTDPEFAGQFPNQEIPLKDLLYNKNVNTNPLMKNCGDDEVRYFHIPANNMEWIEEAIARHYNEERPREERPFSRTEYPSKSNMMLRPEIWRDQQNGRRNAPIHARHMRPRCSIISTDPTHLEDTPKNVVLYMPYLHWETNRRRTKFEKLMRNVTELRKNNDHSFNDAQRVRYDGQENSRLARIPNSNYPTREDGKESASAKPSAMRVEPTPGLATVQAAIEAMGATLIDETFNRSESPIYKSSTLTRVVLVPATVLGQVLYRAALLWDAMDCYNDQELVKSDLHNDPPLHPRRTLDQSFYWTLKSTETRDTDQVVYRETSPNKNFMHKGTHCNAGCYQCHSDSRMVPRLIMVDQLWLWILGGNTIITSFPQQYGRNPKSGVFQSIRNRLNQARRGEVRNAYDLAFIIIDECSRVFFSGGRTVQGAQPQVIELFQSAIGKMDLQQTISYSRFWETTREVMHAYTSPNTVAAVDHKTKSLININVEGKLLGEIKDILDEVHIMLSIQSTQQSLLKDFTRSVESILAPALQLSKEIGTARQVKTIVGGDDSSDEDDFIAKRRKGSERAEKRRRDVSWTLMFARDVSASLADRITELNRLKDSGERTEKALNDLLNSKQQQAGVVQALEATRANLDQNSSIMLFTVITIIFLPLSFGASVFGMNTAEFNGGLLTLRKEVVFILPFSIGLIIISLMLAFVPIMRTIVSLIFDLAWTKFITATGIYRIWIRFNIHGLSLTKLRVEKTQQWKEEVKTAEQERKWRKTRRELEKYKEKKEINSKFSMREVV